jgi:hypothetical protein
MNMQQQPGDRPRGAPRAAVSALVAWYLVIGLTIVEIAEFLPILLGVEHGSFLLPGIVVASAFILSAIIGIGQGKLWAVRLFRWSVYAAAGCYLPILAMALYAFLGAGPRQLDPTAPDMAIVQFIFSALEPIGFVILFRALAKVRWLDPTSLPREWEPSAITR